MNVAAALLPADRAAAQGRSLDASRDAPIMEAALELIGELGYDNVTMDAIGHRAHASKATIYRRWDSKAALVTQALGCRDKPAFDLPDTGELRTDLIGAINGLTGHFCDGDLAIVTGLLTAMRSDPELTRLLREQMVATKRSVLRVLVDRAVARGQLSTDTDTHIPDEIAPAVILSRLILTGERVDTAFVEHLVDDVLLPALQHRPGSAPPGLS